MVRWLMLLGVLAPHLAAQTTARLVADGRAIARSDPRGALELFQAALAIDSFDYEANWRAAVALVDVGQETPDSIPSLARDSGYAAAEHHARRAVLTDSMQAEGHFALALALGRTALTKSRKSRLRYAAGIYNEATRAIELDPLHHGAHHILGLWHAEARRLSGFTRFMARKLLGGKILGESSWDKAIEHLETAARLDPGRIYHGLDLARVYVDRKRYGAARDELDRILGLPDRELFDSTYRVEARALREQIAGKGGKPSDSTDP
jgi:tetratricopeptide (TPR) repeat protein